jgi:hypothetical protein
MVLIILNHLRLINVKAIERYLFQFKNQEKEITWFRNALYLFLLYRATIYSLNFHDLFSDNRLIFHHVIKLNPMVNLVFFLNNHYSVALGVLFIIGLFALSVLGLAKKNNFYSHLIIWFIVINLSSFLYPTLTAGDYLLHQLLLFNCFFMPKKKRTINVNAILIAFHNTALIAVKWQICLAYLLAAIFKLQDESWMNGTAVYHIFQIPEFSNSILKLVPQWACLVLTFITILYQLSFSFLVWFRSFKIYLFFFGILQHLFIAFFMGLFSFGFIMIICYILFLNYDYSTKNNSVNHNEIS